MCNNDAEKLDKDGLYKMIVAYGRGVQQVNHDANVNVLFGKSVETTKVLTGLTRMLSYGNPKGTTSHVATKVYTSDVMPSNYIKVNIRSLEEIEELSIGGTDFQAYVKREKLAGKSLMLAIPDDADPLVRRLHREGFFNMVHGVRHDGSSALGGDCHLRLPGVLESIEVATPMGTVFPALEDFIGLGENDPTIRNPLHRDHKTWIVPFKGINKHTIDAIRDALNAGNPASDNQVIGMYNYSMNANGNQEGKSPTAMAEIPHQNDAVIAKMKKEVGDCFSHQLQVLAFDPVACAAMVHYLKRDQCLTLEHVKTLPLALQASGLADFLYATHHAHLRGTMDLVAYAKRLHDSFAAIESPGATKLSGDLCNEFRNWLTGLRVDNIAGKAMEVLRGKIGSILFEQLPLSQLVPFDADLVVLAVERKEKEAKQLFDKFEVTPDRFLHEVKTRGSGGKCHYTNLHSLLRIVSGDVAEGTAVPLLLLDEIHKLYDLFVRELVFDCLEDRTVPPYEAFAARLKMMAMEAGIRFLLLSCKEVPGNLRVEASVVNVEARPQHHLSMGDMLERYLKIDCIVVDGNALQGEQFDDHATALKEMAKYVMYRIVEQMVVSTLKVETYVEPSADMVTKSLLHTCIGNPKGMANAVWKMKKPPQDQKNSEIVVGYLQKILRSFVHFAASSTVNFLQGDNHPGTFVTATRTRHAEDQARIAAFVEPAKANINKEVCGAVERAVFSPHLVMALEDIATAIMNPRRKGMLLNGHEPFPNCKRSALEPKPTSLRVWAQALSMAVNTPANEATGASGAKRQLIQERIRATHGLLVNMDAAFTCDTMRGATGYVLGMEGGDIRSKEEFEDLLNKRLEDHPFSNFRAEYLDHDKSPEMAAALYEKYTAEHCVDVGEVVRIMGMSIAQIVPPQLAHLCPGGRHAALRYLPSKTPRLTPQACFDALRGTTRGAKAVAAKLGITEDLRKFLEGAATLSEMRQRLETYVSTGEDYVWCVAFELLWTAITKRRAISVLVITDAEEKEGELGAVHEYTWRPELSIKPLEECEEMLRNADLSVFKNMADHSVLHRFLRDEDSTPMDVIVVCGGKFYVCKGTCCADEELNEGRGQEEETAGNTGEEAAGNEEETVAQEEEEEEEPVEENVGGPQEDGEGENNDMDEDDDDLLGFLDSIPPGEQLDGVADGDEDDFLQAIDGLGPGLTPRGVDGDIIFGAEMKNDGKRPRDDGESTHCAKRSCAEAEARIQNGEYDFK